MSRGRLISVLSGVVLASGVAVAQPKASAPAPAAPAAGAPAPAPADGSGSAVQPIEEAPPSDMEGTSEDPDAPRGDDTTTAPTGPAQAAPKSAGYPIEEAERPLVLPQNMTEASIAPHIMADPFQFSDALRIRFGLTRQVQLGLTYAYGGVFDLVDPMTGKKDGGFHVGKTAGLDVTVLLQNWLGVRVGVPVYFSPIAVGLNLGAPMKFRFGKLAIGGLDEVFNFKLSKFAPRFDFEGINQITAALLDSNTTVPNGFVRFAGYGVYQLKPNTAVIGRFGVETPLNPSSSGTAGTGAISKTTSFLRAGIQITPKKFVDLGINAGLDDLSRIGSFALGGFLAVRI